MGEAKRRRQCDPQGFGKIPGRSRKVLIVGRNRFNPDGKSVPPNLPQNLLEDIFRTSERTRLAINSVATKSILVSWAEGELRYWQTQSFSEFRTAFDRNPEFVQSVEELSQTRDSEQILLVYSGQIGRRAGEPGAGAIAILLPIPMGFQVEQAS